MPDLTSVMALSTGIDPALSRATATLARARNLEGSPDTAKVQQAAREFESILLTQWLEQARQSFAGAPNGDEDDPADPGGEQMLSLGMQSLATATTKAGGIGIARMLTRHLENQNGGAAIQRDAGGEGSSVTPAMIEKSSRR